MLTYQVDPSGRPLPTDDIVRRLAKYPECAREMGELADVLAARSRLEARAIPGLEGVPLQLHGSYRIREILSAVGYYTPTHRPPFQAGVLALRDRRVELLFVTLDKSEGYHERIAYRDYAVSPTRFHWQTQHSAGPDTAAGRRYVESRENGWGFQLFVRVRKEEAYRACGPVFVEHPGDVTGDRPMNVEWTLGVALPARVFAELSVLRGQG